MQRVEAQCEDDRRLAEYILQWVSFAVRPLSLNDLQEALIVEPDSDGVDETNIRDAELLTSVCAEFVVVDQYGKVRLVHSSKLEIFEHIRFIRFPTAQGHIVRNCLMYLFSDEFAAGSCSDDDTDILGIRQHHLFSYAARLWEPGKGSRK